MSQKMEIKYPKVTVQLTGTDGNVFAIIGTVARQLRRQVSQEAAKEFTKAAMESDSYDAVLALCFQWVNVE